ncbi:MAG: hypothetical protein ACI8RD_007367 [Bacillariaceae sp.]|jgi:hypothetical protein
MSRTNDDNTSGNKCISTTINDGYGSSCSAPTASTDTTIVKNNIISEIFISSSTKFLRGSLSNTSITEDEISDRRSFLVFLEDSDFLSVRTYLDGINIFDLKFIRIRLLNNVFFLVGSVLYVSMDILPFSELNVDDDDFYKTVTNWWINKDSIIYFCAASMFVCTALLDFYLIKLGGSSSPEIEEQIINRERARIRARKRTLRNDGTVMGFVPYMSGESEEEEELGCKEVDDDHDNPYNIIVRCFHNFQKSISMVLFVAWTLLLGGIFGVALSVVVVKYLLLSNILNAVSVHLFLVQACAMIYARLCSRSRYGNDNDNDNGNDDDDGNRSNDCDGGILVYASKWMLILADFAFFFGALIDVIYSYFEQATVATLISGMLWLICSILYMMVTLYDYHIVKGYIENERKSFVEVEKTRRQRYNSINRSVVTN